MSNIFKNQEISKQCGHLSIDNRIKEKCSQIKQFFFKYKIPLLLQLNTIANTQSWDRVYFGLILCIHVKCENFPWWCYKTFISHLPSGTSADTNWPSGKNVYKNKKELLAMKEISPRYYPTPHLPKKKSYWERWYIIFKLIS